MDFSALNIKIDPGTATTTLEQVHGRLKATETQGQQTRAAIDRLAGSFRSMAQAMQQEQQALARIPLNNLATGFGRLGEMMGRVASVSDRLARANDPLAQGFGRVAAQMQREQEILQSIRAPQMEYFDTLAALDKLLERNAINTAEYAAQVTKLNRAQSDASGASKPTLKSGIGAIGSTLLAGGGLPAAALVIGHQVESLIGEYEKLDDQYTDLYNEALKFTDATHSVNAVLAQQSDLAIKLHTTLAQTMDIYDGVGDALNDMNLSATELARITQTVGEASQLANRPLASTGDLINRMVTSMNSGTDAAEALRTVMVQVPEIAQLWEKAFHTDEAGLMALARHGKITSEDLVRAFQTTTAAIDADFAKRRITNAEQRRMIEERIALYSQEEGDILATYEAVNPELRKFNQQMASMNNTASEFAETLTVTNDKASEFAESLQRTEDKVTKVTNAIRAGSAQVRLWTAVTVSQQIAADPVIRYLGDYESKLRMVAEGRQALDTLLDQGRISLGYYKQQLAALTGEHEAAAHAVEHHALAVNSLARGLAAIGGGIAKGAGKFVDVANQQAAADQKQAAADQERLNEEAEKYAAYLRSLPSLYDQWESRARDAISGIDSGWKQILHDATDSASHIKGAMTDAFSTIQDSLTNMVLKGKLDLGSLASSLEQIAVRLAVQEATGGLMGLIGGGMTGFDYLTPGGSGRLALPGFARGGDVMVGGSGAPDSKVAMFRVSPGESISVRTPQQREAMAGAMTGGSSTVVNLNYDPRAIRQGRDIEDGVYAAIRRNPAAFRALLAG